MYFYLLLFIILTIISGIFVITSKNPIQSVLFLVLVFLFSTIIFMIIGAEFVSILMLIVYVGAISILFLFVVMLLNLRIVELYSSYYHYMHIGAFIGFLFILELVLSINVSNINLHCYMNNLTFFYWIDLYNSKSNLILIGELLYTYFNLFFVVAAIILLVSMIGVIILTLEESDLNKESIIDKMDFLNYDLTKIKFWKIKKYD